MLCEAFKKKSTKIISVQGFYAPAKIATFFAILSIFTKTSTNTKAESNLITLQNR